MLTIHKYPLSGLPSATVTTHLGATVLDMQEQDGHWCAWLRVDTTQPKGKMQIEVFGTGHDLPPGMQHVKTWQTGPFVWHAFASAVVLPTEGPGHE